MTRLTKDPWWGILATLVAVCLMYGLVFGPLFLSHPPGLPAEKNNAVNAQEVVWFVEVLVLNITANANAFPPDGLSVLHDHADEITDDFVSNFPPPPASPPLPDGLAKHP